MLNATLGNILARITQSVRVDYGEPLSWKGSDYSSVEKLLSITNTDDLPAGIGINGADAKPAEFELSPGEFTDGVYPAENDTVTRQGVQYTVLRVEVAMVGGVAHSLLLFCYRSPASSEDSVAPAGEPDAGKRKTYYPPAITD